MVRQSTWSVSWNTRLCHLTKTSIGALWLENRAAVRLRWPSPAMRRVMVCRRPRTVLERWNSTEVNKSKHFLTLFKSRLFHKLHYNPIKSSTMKFSHNIWSNYKTKPKEIFSTYKINYFEVYPTQTALKYYITSVLNIT